MTKLANVINKETREILKASAEITCPVCDGTGWKVEPCKNCNGKGIHENTGAKCTKCHGTGKYVFKKTAIYSGSTCRYCHGKGTVNPNNQRIKEFLSNQESKSNGADSDAGVSDTGKEAATI